MSSVAAQIESMDATPDKIEAEIGWRVWLNHGGVLHSVTHDAAWPKGKPLEAACKGRGVTAHIKHRWGWHIVSPKGVAVEIGSLTQTHVESLERMRWGMWYDGKTAPPNTALPDGYAYRAFHDQETISEETQPIPHESCHCGIYASDSPGGDCKSYLHSLAVFGKVRLWGRVVPGSRGWRAERAYPEHLYVLEGLATRGFFRKRQSGEYVAASLAGYGVPVDLVSSWNEVGA